MSITDLKPTQGFERIDTLVALALAFSKSEAESEDARVTGSDNGVLELLSGLGEADQRAVEDTLARFQSLPPDEQVRWLAGTFSLARAGVSEECARLDENVHPSHILEALRAEPKRIQTLVLSNIPRSLAEPVAAGLGIPLDHTRPRPVDDGASGGLDGVTVGRAPDAKIVAVLRRAFLSNFVTADMLHDPTDLDLLSRVDLARLVRILGVREVAIACRGIAAVETIGPFLRRFSAEDSHAIAFHIGSLAVVEPERVDFAERAVGSAMEDGLDGAEMLDGVGLSLLARAMARRDSARRRYTVQKLPLAAVRELDSMTVNSPLDAYDRLAQVVIDEVEALARNLRRQHLAQEFDRKTAREANSYSGAGAEDFSGESSELT